MSNSIELQLWEKEIQDYFEWNTDLIERNQIMREKGYNIFAHDVPISLGALKLKLEDLRNLSTPKYRECKKIQKTLEESMKHRAKALQLELKHFENIEAKTLAGRFGAGATIFSATMADNLLKESMTEFYKMFQN